MITTVRPDQWTVCIKPTPVGGGFLWVGEGVSPLIFVL